MRYSNSPFSRSQKNLRPIADYQAPFSDLIADYTYLAPLSIEQAGVKKLYLVQADGSAATPLVSDLVAQDTPSWSPDGKRIAFSFIRNASPEIGIVNRDGTGFVQLTNDGQQNRSPVWSPDGRRLAFLSAQGGVDDVYVMNDDGSNVIRLTRNDPCTVGCGGPPDVWGNLYWLP